MDPCSFTKLRLQESSIGRSPSFHCPMLLPNAKAQLRLKATDRSGGEGRKRSNVGCSALLGGFCTRELSLSHFVGVCVRPEAVIQFKSVGCFGSVTNSSLEL